MTLSKITSFFIYKLICIAVVVMGLLINANGQNDELKTLLLQKDKPSVYITFEKRAKLPAIFEGESDRRLFLRINNNTALKVFLCTFDVAKAYGDTGVHYSVRSTKTGAEGKLGKLGYGQADACRVSEIPGGRSLSFSIPEEHLAPSLKISVRIYYGWTGDWKIDMFGPIESFLTFGL